MLPQNQVHIIAGASGSGKTTVLSQQVAAWASGTAPFIPQLAFAGDTLAYIVSERTFEEVLFRLKRLLNIPQHLRFQHPKIEVYGLLNDPSYKIHWLDDPYTALTQAIGKLRNPFDILIIDPVALFIAGNLNNYRDVAKSLFAINRLTISLNITTIATHHATKSRSDFHFLRPQDRISGTAALQGFSGTHLALIEGKESNQPFDTLYAVPHMEPPSEIRLVRAQPHGDFILYDKGESRELANAQKLLDALELKPGETIDLDCLGIAATTNGISRATMFRFITALIDSGQLCRIRNGLYQRTGVKT